MSKVKPRGEVSPLTAAAVAMCMLGVSGLSVWQFVIRDVPQERTHIAPHSSNNLASRGVHRAHQTPAKAK